MPEGRPSELESLLSCDAASREQAWAAFVAGVSRLLLHVARARGGDHDAVMDRYAYILEQLEKDDFRRLRAYRSDGRALFTTWLVVVARRLCLDHQRQRYGRARNAGDNGRGPDPERAQARRLLADLVVDAVDPDLIAGDAALPDQEIRALELRAALTEALQDLEPEARLLLRLRFDDGLAASEIARILKLPTPFHVYRRINQQLATLRDRLERVGIEDAVP